MTFQMMRPVDLLKGECSSMFIIPINQLSSTWKCFRYVRQRVVTYVHLIFTLARTRQDVHKLHKFWIQAVQQKQNLLWGLWIKYTFWTKGTACIWTIFIQVQNFMRNFFFHSTYACGTVHPNGKGLPKEMTNAKLKKTEFVLRHNGLLLAIKWCDKRAVTVLTTIDAAIHVEANKTDAQGDRILKPLAIFNYIKNMGGSDTSDQLISYCSFLWKYIKWWKKLFIHLLNMFLLNAHILNSKYGCKKLDHQGYMKYMANYLITEGSVNCSLKRPPVQCHSVQNDTQGTVAVPMD